MVFLTNSLERFQNHVLIFLGLCLSVCLSVCMYVCMYVCVYVYMYICMYVCMYVSMSNRDLKHSLSEGN